jgi:trk system potassium uptake protein TrkA
MRAVIIGCGRVGSTVARRLNKAGWDVAVVDEDEEAFEALGPDWSSHFLTRVGHGLDTHVLEEAGIANADAVVVATDGDNSNIVIAQIAQKRFGIGCVVVRILDPARAEFFEQQGLRTVCPTSTAIEVLTDAVRMCERPREEVPS